MAPQKYWAETPGVVFDCSGLTQAAYAAAGTRIPRTSTAQWTGFPHVPVADLEPGDLGLAAADGRGPSLRARSPEMRAMRRKAGL